MDLGWPVVALAVVPWPLDVVVLGEVSFDDTRVGPVSTFWVEDSDDLFDRYPRGSGECFRGKNPLGRLSAGARVVGSG